MPWGILTCTKYSTHGNTEYGVFHYEVPDTLDNLYSVAYFFVAWMWNGERWDDGSSTCIQPHDKATCRID